MERWYGKEGDWQTFLNSLPERIPGESAYDVYTRVALKLHPYCKTNFFGKDKSKSVDWATMKRGFEVIRKTCPNSSWDLNLFAFYAVLAKDTPTSMALVRELVDKDLVRIGVWEKPKYFDEVKAWAFHDR